MSMPSSHAHGHLALQPVISSAPAHTGFEQRLAQASLRRVEAKEFVFAEGDPTTHIFQVETGAVALYKVLCDGRRQVVGFAYPGDLLLTTGQRSATERVVSFLLAFSRRNERNGQDGKSFDLPMTRADIADFL